MVAIDVQLPHGHQDHQSVIGGKGMDMTAEKYHLNIAVKHPQRVGRDGDDQNPGVERAEKRADQIQNK